MYREDHADPMQAICFTDAGEELGRRLAEKLPLKLHRSSRTFPVRAWTAEHFKTAGALLYIGAAGIAVRSIAPYIKSKVRDPAVLVMDEKGQFVIPILSGHLGGANDLARRIAEACGAVPVLTTATDVRGHFAVDEWARKNRCLVYNPGKIVRVSSKILDGGTVTMQSDFPIRGKRPSGVQTLPPVKEASDAESFSSEVSAGKTQEPDIVLAVRRNSREEAEKTAAKKETLYLVPRILVLGIGCRKHISAETIEAAFQRFLTENHLYEEAFFRAASIDLKKDEPGLLEFCSRHGLPLQTFTAEELEAAPGEYSASEFVRKVTGTDNVCERSAVLSAGGTILVRKTAENGVTLAAAQMPYRPCWQESEP